MFRAMSVIVAVAMLALGGFDASAQNVGGRLKSIAASKTVKIAHRRDAIPFSFINDRKEITGYTVDICNQVVASLERQLGIQGLKVTWVPVTTQERFDAVASGKADMECGSTTITLGRMKQVDFSNIVFVESTGVLVRVGAGINTLKDVAGKKIAVVTGTSNQQALVSRNEQLKLNAVIVPVKDRDEAAAALEGGQVEGFASDKLLLVGTRFKDNRQLRILPDDLSIEPYAIVLPRGDAELRLAVNTALAQIYRTDEIRKIFERWFGQIGFQPGPLLAAAYVLGALPE
jgi:ABC-type amino acid transport substrate-binding protein